MNVYFRYYRGIIPDEIIKNVSEELSDRDIDFLLGDMSGVPMLCLDQVISQITLVLSHGIVNSIATGIASNAVYDSLKKSITTLSKALKAQTYTKYYHGSGDTKEIPATFGITFRTQNGYFDLQIPPDLNDDLKSKCIEKAFDEIGKQSNQESKSYLRGSNYGRYNEATNSWEYIDIKEEMEKLNNKEK